MSEDSFGTERLRPEYEERKAYITQDSDKSVR